MMPARHGRRSALPLAALGRRAAASPIPPVVLSAALWLWPAVYNGYPLVFDDTGTYLSQAVHRYLGWDRPPFYSIFLLCLHLTVTTWPAVAVQALLAAYIVRLVQRVLLPGMGPWCLVPIAGGAALATALPWFAAQLMPDIFTPLLVLALAMLLFTADRLSAGEQWWLVLFSAFAIAAQQSSMALAPALTLLLLPLRRVAGRAMPLGRAGLARLAAGPALAMAAAAAVNFAGHHRLAVSPYGNVFLLARVIYDGPGMDVLRRDCPRAGWRLCPFRDRMPANSDLFLWRPDSPVMLAGGHVAVSADADAIIAEALRREPRREFIAWLDNTLTQLRRFATGDTLDACPTTVTPWIDADFPPFERAAYAAARQTRGELAVPAWMQRLHEVTAVIGIAGCAVLLVAGIRCRHRAAGFAAAVLLAVLLNAGIAGGLSTTHDRYGSRVMLLAPMVALLGGLALLRRDSTAAR